MNSSYNLGKHRVLYRMIGFKEGSRFYYVALMMKLELSSNKVLRCMHMCICISKGKF